MGFLDALSVAAPIAANAVGTYEHAQAQGAQQKQQQIIQSLQMKRQQQEDALKQAIADRQAKSAGITDALNTYKLQHPTIDPNSQEAMDRRTQSNIQETHEKIDYDRTHGYHAPHNLDPLSPEGIRATMAINAAKIAAAVKAKGGAGGGTPAQELAGAQYQVAKEAAPGIDEYKPGIASKIITHIPVVGNKILGWVDPDYQQLDRDSRQFIEAYMHAQGGRRVAQAEYDRLKGIYIPTPGDNERTRQRKIAARQTTLQSMHRMAGPVGDEVDRDMANGVQVPPGSGSKNPFDDLIPSE